MNDVPGRNGQRVAGLGAPNRAGDIDLSATQPIDITELMHIPVEPVVLFSQAGGAPLILRCPPGKSRLKLRTRSNAGTPTAEPPPSRPWLVPHEEVDGAPMSSAVQVCWEKFCNYWDIEPRYVPITEEHKIFDGVGLDAHVDENTIGVVAIMGATYTGMYEPVKQIAEALDAIQATTGLDIAIHVDAASGGMIAPFLQPELEWDFRLERVHSINTSGHRL